jgi:hypothetical protein
MHINTHKRVISCHQQIRYTKIDYLIQMMEKSSRHSVYENERRNHDRDLSVY